MTRRGQILVDIKRAVKDKFAWPGGYPLFIILADGESLCVNCGKENLGLIAIDTQPFGGSWRALGIDINWEDSALRCVHCSKLIESAYNE